MKEYCLRRILKCERKSVKTKHRRICWRITAPVLQKKDGSKPRFAVHL